MTDIETKEALIVRYETLQARRLAQRVITKPLLTVWYILIPVIFVYYFFRLNRYTSSCREFVDHYIRSRRRAIDAAAEAVARNCPPDIEDLVARSRTPVEAKSAYTAYSRVLVDHYMDLINADGNDMETLLRSAYRNRGNYLIFINRLGEVEKALDRALAPSLVEEHPAVGETIARIEEEIARLRRAEAERVFS